LNIAIQCDESFKYLNHQGPISQSVYRKALLHFNSAALVDAAKGYEGTGLQMELKWYLTGAMSTAEIGKVQ
jgi:deoxyhypusine synthase